jgi:hypothetical protein
MAITVALQNIHGKKINEVVPATGLLNHLLPLEDPGFPLLCNVDPYGNTIFNGLQMRPLLEELDRLAGNSMRDEEKKVLEEIRELAIQCRDHSHTYLRFIGD